MSTSDFISLSIYAKDITGQVFGRLTVLGPVGVDKGRKVLWKCACSCGNIRTNPVTASSLRSGNTNSCGCLWAESQKTRSMTHGLTGSREHRAWKLMRQRTLNPNHPDYHYYANRKPDPIFDDFSEFLKDIGPCPGKGYTVDRVNNDLGYVPGNLRWATRLEQSNNMSSNVRITDALTGVVKSLSEGCREKGLTYSTIRGRINALGWSVEEATNGHYV